MEGIKPILRPGRISHTGNLQGLVSPPREQSNASPLISGLTSTRDGLADSSSLAVPFLPGLERHEDYDTDETDDCDEDDSAQGDSADGLDDDKEFDPEDWVEVEEYIDDDGERPSCPCAAWWAGLVALGHVTLGLVEVATVLNTPQQEQQDRMAGRVCLLAVLGTLVFDNATVALGRCLDRDFLRALSQGRCLLRIGAVPLLIICAVDLGRQAGVEFLFKRTALGHGTDQVSLSPTAHSLPGSSLLFLPVSARGV